MKASEPMQRTRSLALFTLVTCLQVLTVTVAAEATPGEFPIDSTETTAQVWPVGASNPTQVTDWVLWSLGIAESCLTGWLGFWFAIWIAGLWLAPSRVRQANRWFGRLRIGRLRFGHGTHLTVAHLVLVRLFAPPEPPAEQSTSIDESAEKSGEASPGDKGLHRVTIPPPNEVPIATAAMEPRPRIPAFAEPVSPEFEQDVIDRLAESVHRHNALSTLARVERVLQAVVAALVDNSGSDARRSASGAGAYARYDVNTSHSADRASEESVAEVRHAATQAVGRLGPMAADAVPGLTLMLDDSNADCRRGAVVALGWIGSGSSEAAPRLAKLMADNNRGVRVAASDALGAIGHVNREIVGVLCHAAQDDDPAVRIAATRSLGKLGVGWPEAIPALRTALRDDHPEIRRQASKSLGLMGPLAKAAMGDLERSMSDNSVLVRRSVATALSKIDLATVPVLNRALDDEDAEVRRIAATALSGIGLAAVPALLSSLRKETLEPANPAGGPLPNEN